MTDRENPRKFPVWKLLCRRHSDSKCTYVRFLWHSDYEDNLHSPRNLPRNGRLSMTLTDAADYLSWSLFGHGYFFIVFFVLNPYLLIWLKCVRAKRLLIPAAQLVFDAIAHLLLETGDQIKWITLLKGRQSLLVPDVKQTNCIVYVSWTCLILVLAKSSNVDVNLVPRQTRTFTSVSQLCHVFAYLSVYLTL